MPKILSCIDGLSEKDAHSLAADYNFPGGQIENISRKIAVDYILSGVCANMDGIRKLCENECITSADAPRTRIGF